MYSTIKSTKLDYSRLVRDYERIVVYLFNSSDRFCTVATGIRPYSRIPPMIRQNTFDLACCDYCIERMNHNDRWPKEIEKVGKHKVLLVYDSKKKLGEIVKSLGNPFILNETVFPEDMYFYREGRLWFYAIQHERLSFAFIENKKDAEYLIM